MLTKEENTICMEAVSPIKFYNEVIGYDLLGFNLDKTIELLNQDPIMTLSLTNQQLKVNQVEQFLRIFESEESIYFIEHLNGQHNNTVSQNKSDVFRSKNKLTIRVLMQIGTGYTFVLLFIYVFIIHYSREQIRELSIEIDNYRNFADKDTLTGANSRLYMDKFIQAHPLEQGVLILIDLDNFEEINNAYGHIE